MSFNNIVFIKFITKINFYINYIDVNLHTFPGQLIFLFLSIDFIMESNSSFINDGSEYKYYVGKVKRPEGWKKLRNKVLESLNKTTILIFLMWFHEDLQQYFEGERKKLPGTYYLVNVIQ